MKIKVQGLFQGVLMFETGGHDVPPKYVPSAADQESGHDVPPQYVINAADQESGHDIPPQYVPSAGDQESGQDVSFQIVLIPMYDCHLFKEVAVTAVCIYCICRSLRGYQPYRGP